MVRVHSAQGGRQLPLTGKVQAAAANAGLDTERVRGGSARLVAPPRSVRRGAAFPTAAATFRSG
jgi:hypothetical protein